MNIPVLPSMNWEDFNPQAPRTFEMPAHQTEQQRMMRDALAKHVRRNEDEYLAISEGIREQIDQLARRVSGGDAMALAGQWMAYLSDVQSRSLLFADILRQRGDIFLEHEADGAPPVLIYDYDIVADGKDLRHPCNYMLLRIRAPQGIETFEWKRPYVIIDPRAGHGPGIGGFKKDSQVGVALADGHPVYFVAFRPEPVPGQTIADVTRAEAQFIRWIRKHHPDAPKPIVVGNCQGGWATAILAATNPDLAGPIVLNGAPMSYWSGKLGQDPMRYTGGVAGGVLPAIVVSDLGGGVFDGANLVMNFEMLNPGRTWFRKYYDVFAKAGDDPARFLEFEKWWGGFFLMNGEEMRWIVENLFVGNRLGMNEARLERGRSIDLKAIRAPIIVFASHGDNITPPQQALNWIVDTYADEREIEVLGQRIIYMIHEEVGHLGIFVSSSVAKKEHSQMASTLKTIEFLAPGLYEMVITKATGEGDERSFAVDFQKRKMADIAAVDDHRGEEPAFGAVARMSENLAEAYELTARPFVRAAVSRPMGAFMRHYHPLRLQRSMFASSNPVSSMIAGQAETLRETYRPLGEANPFVAAERIMASQIEFAWDIWRDGRAIANELAFLALYTNPLAMWFGAPKAESRTLKHPDDLQNLQAVQDALDRISLGGLAEAVVRILVALANTRGDVRRDRLERSSSVLSEHEVFVSIDPMTRARMIHQQTLVVQFAPDAALDALPLLLPTEADRVRAMDMIDYIVGSVEEMETHTLERLNHIRSLLGMDELKQAGS